MTLPITGQYALGTTLLVASLLWVACTCTLKAQLDDLADASWAAPQLDMVQQLANEPLCLLCTKPSQLTVIPGFGRTAAARVCAAARSGMRELEEIADSACLTSDQRLLLNMCTTTTCTCRGFVQSVSTRVRCVTVSQARPDMLVRTNVQTQVGRVGGVARSSSMGTIVGGWLFAETPIITVGLGDVALSSGLGLVHGSGGMFGRSLLTRMASADVQPRIRPWSSTLQDGMQRGGILHFHDSSLQAVQGVVAWSQRQHDERRETAIHALAMYSLYDMSVSVGLQDLMYDKPSESRSMSVVPQTRQLFSLTASRRFPHGQATVEVACDNALHVAAVMITSLTFTQGQLLATARWSHPDIRNPYAAPISSTSSLGNERGIGVGILLRLPRRIHLEASLDVHESQSKLYGSPQPTRGVDMIADLEVNTVRSLTLSTRLRYELDTEGWQPPGDGWTRMRTRERITARADVVLSVLRSLRLRARVDMRTVHYSSGGAEYGYLAFVDASWLATQQLRLALRVTSFNSASSISAAYALEVPIVGMSMTVPGSGIGTRLTASLRYSPTSWCTASVGYWDQQRLSESRHGGGIQLDLHW